MRGRNDVEAELTALVRRYPLPDAAADRLSQLLALLADDPHAPTAIREPVKIVTHHLADSLVALELPVVGAARAIVDIGSGAGLPGLALAIALPDADVVLLEANRRKCAFITKSIEVLQLANATAMYARAESWKEGLGKFDLATARAVGPLTLIEEYAAPLLRVGGWLVAWKGRRDRTEEAAAALAALELGLEPTDPIGVQPYSGAEHRHLHVLAKVTATPSRFPRRPGAAQKRPLGALPRKLPAG